LIQTSEGREGRLGPMGSHGFEDRVIHRKVADGAIKVKRNPGHWMIVTVAKAF
jgi:hypothetical protein